MTRDDAGRIDPFLAAAGARLRQSSIAYRDALEHRGESGRGHERALADELGKLLPGRVAIKTGAVIGVRGTLSKQLDLILCDGSNYPTFGYSAGDLVMPDAVLAVISVKTNLRPDELGTYFREAAEFKKLMREALGQPWRGVYAVVAYWAEGTEELLTDRFHSAVFANAEKGAGADLVAAIDRGPVCLDLATLGEVGEPPRFVASRAHVPGIAMDACVIDSLEPFVDLYKLILRRVDARLSRIIDLAVPASGVEIPEGVSRDPAFHATFVGRSADLTLAPGVVAEFQVFYANVGAATWSRGTATEARLVLAGPKGHETPSGVWRSRWLSSDTYCAQFQDVVAPGQIAQFKFEIAVPMDARRGEYRFYGRPSVAGVGALTETSRASAVTVADSAPPGQMFPASSRLAVSPRRGPDPSP